ncbi:hypothetical protein MKX01_008561 [Papaver californicum]|nr:hypothetical protein MKX01_008561 [Papaver californicum]
MGLPVSVDKVKDYLLSQYRDEAKWELNKKLLRAAGLFGGSILVMRNFGDIMSV